MKWHLSRAVCTWSCLSGGFPNYYYYCYCSFAPLASSFLIRSPQHHHQPRRGYHHHDASFSHRTVSRTHGSSDNNYYGVQFQRRCRHQFTSCLQAQSNALEHVENVILKLATKGSKSWPRFRPLVEMALTAADDDNNNVTRFSVADIGTDHGLLSLGLAASGKFRSVIGVDVSQRALQDGALTLLQQIQQKQSNNSSSWMSALSFRHGDGLKVLQPGEGDIVCMAGMGVHTMTEVLSTRATTFDDQNIRYQPPLLLDHDYLNTQLLLTQPTNTRPRNLIALYEFLYQHGFDAHDEQLLTLSGRWYVTISFQKRRQQQQQQPTTLHYENQSKGLPVEEFPLTLCCNKATTTTSDDTRNTLKEQRALLRGYLIHHCSWLYQEKQQAGHLRGREEEWLAKFEQILVSLENECPP